MEGEILARNRYKNFREEKILLCDKNVTQEYSINHED